MDEMTCICGRGQWRAAGHEFCDYDYEDLTDEQRAVVDAIWDVKA